MKKGFTLIEVMAVIIILGVLVGFAYPKINNSIKNSKEKVLKQNIKTIEEAANKYITANDLENVPVEQILTLDQLKNDKLLKNELINPITKENMNGCVIYKWNNEYNQFDIKYTEDCGKTTNLIFTLLKQYDENNKVGLLRDKNNPNRYYYKGTTEEVSNNFLWYGGYTWRILEFDTDKKTLKLISQLPVTIINAGMETWSSVETYNNNYINKWLNDYFYNSFNDSIKNNIINSEFNIGISDGEPSKNYINKIGLLDIKQYNDSMSVTSYLNIKNYFLLSNINNKKNIIIADDGIEALSSSKLPLSIRPLMSIKDIQIIDGDGTLKNNYKYVEDELQVGDYIKIPYKADDNICGNDKKCIFRIVSKDNNSFKVIFNGFLPNESVYGDNLIITKNNTIYNALGNFFQNISDEYKYLGYEGEKPADDTKIVYKSFNIGKFEDGHNYDLSNEKLYANYGLPVVGEIFTCNDINMQLADNMIDFDLVENHEIFNNDWYWTMNRFDDKSIQMVSHYGVFWAAETQLRGRVRPVIFLKNNLEFISGDGSPSSPYELK